MAVRPPKYRLHKGSGQALVQINGRRIYIGTYGSEQSKERYRQLVAHMLKLGIPTHAANREALPEERTVDEVIVAYWRHVESYYRKLDGTPTSEVSNIRQALRPLQQLYGHTQAREFGPLALKSVRQAMIDAGWSRGWINRAIDRIKRMFRWATESELVPASTYQALRAVSGLRRGRSDAKETAPVTPVLENQVDAIRPHVSRQVWSMIELQLLTGMRPGEVVIMRTCDINTKSRIWTYTPGSHKTAHHGHRRIVILGPKSQAILKPWLRQELRAYLFQPREAESMRRSKLHQRRITPLSCGNRPGTNRRAHPKRRPGERYTTMSYGKAIIHACDKAFPTPNGIDGDERKAWRRAHRWSPGRLRHNAATSIRREFGIEIARIILGHRSAVTTEIYAEVDFQKAAEIVAKIG